MKQISIESIRLELDFEPSMKTLSRIVKFMKENESIGKNQLSLRANIQYARLANHVDWLEKKGFVESTIDKSKINVGLTEKGKVFASMIL